MKRMIYLISFLLLTTVLAGCISIPIGDEVMKISMDGVEFVDKDEKEANENDLDNEEPNDESNTNEESNNSNKENGSSNEEDESNHTGNDDANNNTDSNNNDYNTEDATAESECEEQDHSERLKNLPPDFYIPECAEVTRDKEHSMYYNVWFEIEGGDWEEIYADYLDYFGDDMDQKEEVPGDEHAEVRGKLLGSEAGQTRVVITQEEEYVDLYINHYK